MKRFISTKRINEPDAIGNMKMPSKEDDTFDFMISTFFDVETPDMTQLVEQSPNTIKATLNTLKNKIKRRNNTAHLEKNTQERSNMSKENVKKFYEALKQDNTLADNLKKTVKQATPEDMESAAACVVKFAAEKGYQFTIADLKDFEIEAVELSGEELENINAAWGACTLIGFGGLSAGTSKAGFGACSFIGLGLGEWH